MLNLSKALSVITKNIKESLILIIENNLILDKNIRVISIEDEYSNIQYAIFLNVRCFFQELLLKKLESKFIEVNISAYMRTVKLIYKKYIS